MSNTGFTFPPPPPPPPKKDTMPGAEFGGYGRGNRSGSFNRGNDRGGGSRGRGRGFGGGTPQGNSFSGSRGRARGQAFSGPPPPSNGFIGHRNWSHDHSDRRAGSANSAFTSNYKPQEGHSQPGPRPTSSSGANHWIAPQKRDHATAFNHRGRGGSKPPAAPSVPSFLSNIPGLSPAIPSTGSTNSPKSPVEKKVKSRISNILGLNPSVQGPESDEDDEDEEAKLATTTTAADQTGVAFEYRGQTARLKTPAEIAAWIADRKKRFPTAAKAEQAKKEAQEKQNKWEEEKKANQEARRLQRESYEREKAARVQEMVRAQKVEGWLNSTEATKVLSGGKEKAPDAAEKARLKTEKLIRKAAKAQKQLAKAQDALKKAQGASAPNPSIEGKQKQESTVSLDEAGAPDTARPSNFIAGLDDSDASSILTDTYSDDETSSSGSSSEDSAEDSDSVSSSAAAAAAAAAPEPLTTKRTAPDRVPPPPRTAPPASSSPCRNMMKYGKCKAGAKCRFSHDPELALQVAKQRGSGKEKSRKNVEVSQVTGRPRRKGLWEAMVEKEREEEARAVLRLIVEMGERGLLEGGD